MKGLPITLFAAVTGGAVLFTGCESIEEDSTDRSFGPYGPRGIEDTVQTPSHRLSQRDFPFTRSGRYVREWAYAGETRYTGRDSDPEPRRAPRPEPERRRETEPRREIKPPPVRTRPAPTRVAQVDPLRNRPPITRTPIRTPSARPVQPPPRVASSTPKPKPKPSYRYHTVQKGETLWRIGQKYDVTISSVIKANGLKNYIIRPGQRLKIPR